MSDLHLVTSVRDQNIKQEPIRAGFGAGLLEAGRKYDNVVGLCADLTDSTKMSDFANEFPDRFVEVGIGEQNLATLASGMAAMGKVTFIAAYAAFSPGRNWEQIRTTIALNEQPVKIIGSHAGISVGPDGATHQSLEDIAIMRAMPNMIVIAPCDAVEAKKATLALAADTEKPAYMRLAREKTPVITTEDTPFEIGKAQLFREGSDVTIVATGTMTYHAMVAAEILAADGVQAEVVHVATVKPLDKDTILASARKTRAVVTAEEAQVIGGLGGAVAELLSEEAPTIMKRIGIQDRFGESGDPVELYEHFGLTAANIAMAAHDLISKLHQ